MNKAKMRCDSCAVVIKEACLVVHDPNGVSGIFCGDPCYQSKISAANLVSPVITTIRDRHADVEVVLGSEG